MAIFKNPFAKAAPEQKASVAKALIALNALGAPVWTPRDYASLARQGYERNVIAYRCVRLIAETAPRRRCWLERRARARPWGAWRLLCRRLLLDDGTGAVWI